jgi:hypothetical protein
MNPWLVGAYVVFLGGSILWRKITEKKPALPRPPAVSLPRTEEGSNIPIVIGRVRVRSPILAYDGKQFALSVPDNIEFIGLSLDTAPSRYVYLKNLHWVLGFAMEDGNGTSHIYNMWLGTQKLGHSGTVLPEEFTGFGNFEPLTLGRAVWDSAFVALPSIVPAVAVEDESRFQFPFQCDLEFLNGHPNQLVILGDDSPSTYLGKHMTVTTSDFSETYRDYSGTIPPEQVPAYRGLLSAFLFHLGDTSDLRQYCCLGGPSMPSPSFEVSSNATSHALLGPYATIFGIDANPAVAIFDLLTGRIGKLGIPESNIDVDSFVTAAQDLNAEHHGYSRSFENGETAEEMLEEILTQIHAVLFEDRATGKLVLRLIRPNYDPSALLVLNKNNCEKFDLESVGWSDLPNKVRVTYASRAKDYEQDSVAAQSLASIVAEGRVREEVIDYPGVATAAHAGELAERDLADLSRPLMAATALVNREFFRVEPGQPIMVVMSDPDISSIVFRVISIDLGTLEQGAIRLGLVQDSAYVHRLSTPLPPDFGSSGLDGLGIGG